MPAAPALTIARARVLRAGAAQRAQLQSRLVAVLAAATPAATGVPDGALLLLRRVALAAPLDAPPGRAGAVLVEQLRALRAAARKGGQAGDGDLYLEHPDEAELLLVSAALAGTAPHPLLLAHLADAAQPLTRWRRHLLIDAARLPALLTRLAGAGLMAWLARFTPAELDAAAERLLPALPTAAAANAPMAAHAAPAAAVPHIVTAALAASAGLPPAAARLAAAGLIAAAAPALLPLPAVRRALDTAGQPPAPTGQPRGTTAVTLRQPAVTIGRAPATIPPPPTANAAVTPRHRAVTPRHLRVTPGQPAVPHRQPNAHIFSHLHDISLHSDFAGLFFLIPAFTALGLYGDFTNPKQSQSQTLPGLSPFALIWWLGRHWRGPAFLADPLSSWLRTAAGLGRREPVTRWFQPGEPITPRRWLGRLSATLLARLGEALDSPDPVAILLAQPGEIISQSETLVIRFPLAGHPLALRIAGLDRDPGWLPAAGRHIRFEFPC